MAHIYHLVPRDDWEAASSEPEYSADSLASEGFIHCSKDHEQLFAVARRLYRDRTDMLVLELDTEVLSSPIKEEPSRSGEIYPHIYGQINKTAVVRVLALESDGAEGYTLEEAWEET